MSVKLRLRRLEEAQKENAGPVSYESSAEVKQWLNDTALSINEGTPATITTMRHIRLFTCKTSGYRIRQGMVE